MARHMHGTAQKTESDGEILGMRVVEGCARQREKSETDSVMI